MASSYRYTTRPAAASIILSWADSDGYENSVSKENAKSKKPLLYEKSVQREKPLFYENYEKGLGHQKAHEEQLEKR